MGEIGRMDRRVELKTPTTTKSGMGAPVKSFVHFAYAWAERTPVGDSPEGYQGSRLVVPTRYKYRIHEQSGIDETMQLVDSLVKYNILSVNPVGLFLEIFAEKITE